MDNIKIFASEFKFCLILWENEPINSTMLVSLCKERLNWSKTTTYTVIRRLADRGVLKNENAIVTSLISKEQVQQAELDQMLETTFEGSLPAFIAAFANCKKMSKKDIRELEALIENYDD